MDRDELPDRRPADRRAQRRDHRDRVHAVRGAGPTAGPAAPATTPTRCWSRRSPSSTAYFARERRDFDLPLAPEGTDFQQRVWDQLERIGYGETASYGEIAHRLGMTNAASRAVGLANGRNPIPIVIPCHRVIGADGSLTGYAGGVGAQADAARAGAGRAVLRAAGFPA